MKKGKILFLALAVAFILVSLNFSFVSAGELRVTEEHPFLINGSWIPAHDLVAGEILQGPNGEKYRVVSVEDIVSNESFPVYNLESEDYHNFVVTDDGLSVVVHNSRVALRGDYYGKENIIRLISKDDPENPGVFATGMADTLLGLKPEVGNFKSELVKVGSEMARIAEQTGDYDKFNAINTGLRDIESSNSRPGASMSYARPNGVYEGELYNKLLSNLYEDPTQKRFMSGEKAYDGYPQKYSRAYPIGETTMVEGYPVANDYAIYQLVGSSEENLITIVHTGPKPAVIKYMGELWDKALKAPNPEKQLEATAELEWWTAISNPLHRGGATLTDSLSIALRKKLGLPFRDGYAHKDADALSTPLDEYVRAEVKRSLQLMQNP